MDAAAIEVPAGWTAAIGQIVNCPKRRIVVIGPPDAGKSSFIRAAMSKAADGRAPLKLIDLDPGQKMIGAPGTVSLGDASCLDRFIFIGSTSASEFSRIVKAAKTLADNAQSGFIVNTSGFIRGFGARLQSWTISSLRPDLIVALGDDPSLGSILEGHSDLQIIRLPSSPLARRKSPSARAAIRQAALAQSLDGGGRFELDPAAVGFVPANPQAFEGSARPLCALLDARGDALAMGVVEEADGESITVFSAHPCRPVTLLQLGKIWVVPSGKDWKLSEHLRPSWQLGPVG